MAPTNVTDHSITDLDRRFKELLVKDRVFTCMRKTFGGRRHMKKYVSKSKQMRTYSMSKHVIRTCLIYSYITLLQLLC